MMIGFYYHCIYCGNMTCSHTHYHGGDEQSVTIVFKTSYPEPGISRRKDKEKLTHKEIKKRYLLQVRKLIRPIKKKHIKPKTKGHVPIIRLAHYR